MKNKIYCKFCSKELNDFLNQHHLCLEDKKKNNNKKIILGIFIIIYLINFVSLISAYTSINGSQYFLDVSAFHIDTPLENVNISCYDTYNNSVFSELTDVTGFISSQYLYEFSNFSYSGINIVSGLGDIGSRSHPIVFNMSSNFYLISGSYVGTFFGFFWNGTGWELNSTIVSGLGEIEDDSHPFVFQKEGNWYFITGGAGSSFTGFIWNGTGWELNSTIVSGLGTCWGKFQMPTIFQKDDNFYLISGEQKDYFSTNAYYCGYNWTETGWIEDDLILSGLDIGGPSLELHPVVFQKDNILHLIESGIGKSYIWNGTGWENDKNNISGFYDGNCIFTPHPNVFNMNSEWYLIKGDGSGTFCGYIWNFNQWLSMTINKNIYYSNYTLYADKYGYVTQSKTFNLTSNLGLTFLLDINISEPICDSEHLSLCLTQGSCLSFGGCWIGGGRGGEPNCIICPEPTNPIIPIAEKGFFSSLFSAFSSSSISIFIIILGVLFAIYKLISHIFS
jgi:hypothetical protein